MGQRILVVDDDSDALVMMKLILQRRDFNVLTAPSGSQALNLMAREMPDLVILDVMMPQMDGYEVCRRIRSDPRTTHLPVVMLTARAQPAQQMEGLRAGADDYIAKPVHPTELVERITAVLERVVSPPEEKIASVISVLGVRGGVGATTLAVNLALALSSQASIVMADFEVGGTAAIHLGLDPVQGLSDLLAREVENIDQASVEAALTLHPSGLRLLAAAPSPIDPDRANAILNHLLTISEVCLFDLGTGLYPAVSAMAQRSDNFVLVLDSDRAALAHAGRVVQSLKETELSPQTLKFVWINRMGLAASAAGAAREAIRNTVGQDLVAVIGPAPEEMYQAMEQGAPLVNDQPDHAVAIQIQELAASLISAERHDMAEIE